MGGRAEGRAGLACTCAPPEARVWVGAGMIFRSPLLKQALTHAASGGLAASSWSDALRAHLSENVP